MSDLPAVIPIFPLPNVVLFPGVPLPLHIFEPRYRDMVRDAAATEERLIGMVLLRGDWRRDYYGSPQIFATGCAGRMLNIEQLADGRYNILLHGLREFVVEEELSDLTYRRARVRWRGLTDAVVGEECRARLDGLLRRYVRSRGPDAAKKVLDDGDVADDLRLNFFCYALELSSVEKQALLEASSVRERAERLCDVLEFAIGANSAQSPEIDRYH
jgi:Lon protease-like protein